MTSFSPETSGVVPVDAVARGFFQDCICLKPGPVVDGFKTAVDSGRLMGSLFRNILLLPGQVVITFLRAIGLAPPAPRLCIRRSLTSSPLAISVSAFFWGGLVLIILALGLKPGQTEPEPAVRQQPTSPAASSPLPLPAGGNGETRLVENDPQAEPQPAEVWLVILHSIPKRANAEADRRGARAEADRRAVGYKRQGLDAQVFDTDSFPRLKGGFWAVALGPFETSQAAHQIGDLLREQAPGLMVRRVI